MIIENKETKKRYTIVRAGWDRLKNLKTLFKVIEEDDAQSKDQIIDNLAPEKTKKIKKQ